MTDFINRLKHHVDVQYAKQLVVVTFVDRRTGELFRFEYSLRDVQSRCNWPFEAGSYCLGLARSSLAQMWSPQP